MNAKTAKKRRKDSNPAATPKSRLEERLLHLFTDAQSDMIASFKERESIKGSDLHEDLAGLVFEWNLRHHPVVEESATIETLKMKDRFDKANVPFSPVYAKAIAMASLVVEIRDESTDPDDDSYKPVKQRVSWWHGMCFKYRELYLQVGEKMLELYSDFPTPNEAKNGSTIQPTQETPPAGSLQESPLTASHIELIATEE